MTEAEAIQRCREGDVEGLRVLFDLHHAKAYRLAWRMLGSPEEAEDAVQEVFLKVYRKASLYRGDAAFSTWLYRLTANHCLDELRRRKFRSFLGMEALERFPGSGDPVREAEARRGLSAGVWAALHRLPPRLRACLLLRELEEKSYGEIAEILGLNEGTVKSSLHRAKERLRELLREKKAEALPAAAGGE